MPIPNHIRQALQSTAIVVVAYNAEDTLYRVLERIPSDVLNAIGCVFVGDDESADATLAEGQRFSDGNSSTPMHLIRHRSNLGYGGNQKSGYEWAADEGYEYVVLLHGDGQYAPEVMLDILLPLFEGEADAVFGSRMLVEGAARTGGMPLYKYAGNRILTSAQNRLAGAALSEWHSGYRASRFDAFRSLDFRTMDDGFRFDTQIILGLLGAGKRIVETPIPTYYGDEICHVNGMQYASEVLTDCTRYALRRGRRSNSRAALDDQGYRRKRHPRSSHEILLAAIKTRSPLRILDLGCSDGLLADDLAQAGHTVVGVDVVEVVDTDRKWEFVQADLSAPGALDAALAGRGRFDAVILADVLEHLPDPQALLAQIPPFLAPNGRLLVSVPNVGHWYPRIRFGIGPFRYDARGILDKTHMRFFTRALLRDLLNDAGFDVERETSSWTPFEFLANDTSGRLPGTLRIAGRIESAARLFGLGDVVAYQLIAMARHSESS